MRVLIIVLVLALTAVTAVPRSPQRIVGGSVTTVDNYPEIVGLLLTVAGIDFGHVCGGIILNIRSILTAAHCTFFAVPEHFRIRAGSSYAYSGGVVVNIALLIEHPNFNDLPLNNDITIMRLARPLGFTDVIRPARVAGTHYVLSDNQVVWAAGWGNIEEDGPQSEQLRHVQVYTINQAVCRARYAVLETPEAIVNRKVTENMLCSGVLDVGGRDQCQGDSGGPLYHNGVVVGVCSWGHGCARPFFPGVNVRVSRYTSWIQANA
ncbi:unnamed protein product [Chilo suppressalis]|uniref:Trypsin-like proteinase n=1 Tax=Chilo suppressalis TaxID=168631 RepID=I3UII6_CHISP|nr:trypsin-like proteinase [Chilo suppressalis]CAH0405209.1 unnamed protein product [Chilo suppressalis]